MRIAVVIPVLNEEPYIRAQLESVRCIAGIHEVVVVDGGSTDRTREIVAGFPGVRLISSPRGRANQMNAGAEATSSDVILFLHADVRLPTAATRWISEMLKEPTVVAGAFRTRTVADHHHGWAARILFLADVRSRYSRLPYGDQAIFVRSAVFKQLGGFPAQPLMEDLEFSQRLRRAGGIRIAPATVRVSGRRFLTRPVYYTLLVNVFPLFYRLGVPPNVLASFYGNPR